MGAVLIITAGSSAWINRVFLSNRLAVWFGLISFPLYLWHWPLLSYARIVEGQEPSFTVQITAVVLSVILAWLTYRLIERPIRIGGHGKAKVVTLVIFMALIGYVGYNADVRDGLAFRFNRLSDENKFTAYKITDAWKFRGYPKPDHSHFTSMAIWQSGAPISRESSGWLGRWVESQAVDPMLAISLGSVLPPMLAGTKRSGSSLPLGGLVIPTGALGLNCQKLARATSADNKLMAAAATSMRTLFSVSSTVAPILKLPAPVADELPTLNGGNAGGDSNLAQQLDVVAKLIAAGSPTRVWSVSLGGFDTHANEADAQAQLLGTVSTALTRFASQMKNTPRGKDIVTMVYSEFGRRVKGNASEGTDHGTAGPVFLIGDRVKGGFYGDQPSLSKLINGDLTVTTDFRDIYTAVLEDVLKTPGEKILTGWKSKGQYF